MEEPRLSPAELEHRLELCRRQYAAVTARVAGVGFICEGSLVERWMRCGKPNCHCVEPTRRHGPYYQLSWKERGRTVSRRLSAEEAGLYREWIANRRQLESLVTEMKALSKSARESLLGHPVAPRSSELASPPPPPAQ